MKKAILCLSVLLICGCTVSSRPSITYDCAEADKPAIADFVNKCAGGQTPIFETTGEYNRRLDNCTEKAQQIFCRPIAENPNKPGFGP